MPVVKHEDRGAFSPSNPRIYFDGYEKGLPVLTNKNVSSKYFKFDKEKTPINDIVDYDETNRLTQKLFKRRWMDNAIRNSNNYPDMGNQNSLAKFKNLLSDKPAILIGAGPSLAKNVHLLKNTDITKIAAMHALPFLEREGVKPDFVVHADAMSTDREFITDFSKDITLIAISIVAPAVLRKWKGDISFFSGEVSNSYTDRINSYSTADVTIRPMGCSMAAAMSIADSHMNASSLIFVGNDLCYSKDDDTHVWDGLDYNTNELVGVMPILVDNGKGIRVNTCYQFIMYKNNIQLYAQNRTWWEPFRRYINATEGGMLMLPETMTLKKALKSVANTTYNVNAA